MPAVLTGDAGTTNAGTTRFAIIARAESILHVVDETLYGAEYAPTDRTPHTPSGFSYTSPNPGEITGTIYDSASRNNLNEVFYEVWYKLTTDTQWILGTTIDAEGSTSTNYELTNLSTGLYNLKVRTGQSVLGTIWYSKFYPPTDVVRYVQ